MVQKKRLPGSLGRHLLQIRKLPQTTGFEIRAGQKTLLLKEWSDLDVVCFLLF